MLDFHSSNCFRGILFLNVDMCVTMKFIKKHSKIITKNTQFFHNISDDRSKHLSGDFFLVGVTTVIINYTAYLNCMN